MSLSIPVALDEVGNARYANLSASKALTDTASAGDTLPAAANYAIITVKDQGVHISFDGDDATTDDQYFPADTVLEFSNARTLLKNIEIIQAAATATVYITYFEGPQG